MLDLSQHQHPNAFLQGTWRNEILCFRGCSYVNLRHFAIRMEVAMPKQKIRDHWARPKLLVLRSYVRLYKHNDFVFLEAKSSKQIESLFENFK